jgi:hypothetical protein
MCTYVNTFAMLKFSKSSHSCFSSVHMYKICITYVVGSMNYIDCKEIFFPKHNICPCSVNMFGVKFII